VETVPDADLWTVYLAIPAAQIDAIRIGAGRALPSERHAVLTEERPDGDETHELAVQVAAVSQRGALEQARALYLAAATAGGLEAETDDVLVIGLLSPIFRDPVRALIDEARALLDQRRDDWAVVRAATACQLYAKTALPAIFASRLREDRAAAASRSCRNLNDRRHRDAMLMALGRTPTREPWWAAYDAFIERRNAIVHDGVSVTAEAAVEAVSAAEAFIEWLRALWAEVDIGASPPGC